jgi:hypothetical protein
MKYLEHNGHSNKKRYKLCMLLIMCITMTYIAAGCGSKRDGLTITNVSYDIWTTWFFLSCYKMV